MCVTWVADLDIESINLLILSLKGAQSIDISSDSVDGEDAGRWHRGGEGEDQLRIHGSLLVVIIGQHLSN